MLNQHPSPVLMYTRSLKRDMTTAEEARRAESLVDSGYSAYKLHSAVPGAIHDLADQALDTVRAAVGGDIEIGKELEDLGVLHFGEPRPFYDLEGLATVADALTIPIASGEMIFTHREYRDLIVRGKMDIIQPDIVKVGGFTEFQRIAAVASVFGKPMTVHNTEPTVCTVAHLHICAAYDNLPYAQKYNIEPHSVRDEWPILKNPLQVKGGYLDVPDGPGLGIEFDDDVVNRLVQL